jgi:hypothetical protein
MDEVDTKNAQERVLTINHWNLMLQFVGVIVCGGGVVVLIGFASIVQLWKPQTIVEVIKGCMGYLLLIGFASIWLLAGLKLILGPDGVRIDANKKELCVWRRTLFLNKKRKIFKFEQLKQIKVGVRKKSGKFGPDFNVFSVITGDQPDEVELDYFSTISEAKTLAKRVAEVSGLRFLEYDHS